MITPDEPLAQCYQTVASLSTRVTELRKLLERFSAHTLGYPALYTRGEAVTWVEEGFRLINEAEKLQKKEQ